MSLEFRSPTPEESAMMKEFGGLIESGVQMLIKHELGQFGGLIAQKLQEAMLWHSHALLNKIVEPIEDATKIAETVLDVVKPLEGEVLPADANPAPAAS